jgi:hypothetical protein
MSMIIDGTNGLTFNDATTQTKAGLTGSTSQLAKAWVRFAGSTATINSSFNVSSVTRSSAGKYVINFTTAMSDANFLTDVSSGNGVGYYGYPPNIISPTTSSISCEISTCTGTSNTNPTYYDPQIVCVAVFSS